MSTKDVIEQFIPSYALRWLRRWKRARLVRQGSTMRPRLGIGTTLMPQRLAIATTLRNAAPVLESFIRYHRAVGFDHLFLFFDDPEDRALAEAQRDDHVTAIPNDEHLQQRWKASTLFAAPFAQAEVMARQCLNLEVAIDLARQRHIDWLLHIDVDELFYSAHQSVQDHFAILTARQVPGIIYPNSEAVPEQVDVVDYFKEVTLFKKRLRRH